MSTENRPHATLTLADLQLALRGYGVLPSILRELDLRIAALQKSFDEVCAQRDIAERELREAKPPYVLQIALTDTHVEKLHDVLVPQLPSPDEISRAMGPTNCLSEFGIAWILDTIRDIQAGR
jgi:hypothetical protein